MRRETEGKERKRIRFSASFKTGVIALVFLIIGFEIASFAGKLMAPAAEPPEAEQVPEEPRREGGDVQNTAKQNTVKQNVTKQSTVKQNGIKQGAGRRETRKTESFPFNPNTASQSDFERLGFSEKQAQSLLNYRAKGGRFHRKSDFAESFVVSDSIFKRLEPFIEIPLVDINKADSAALDDLPGIGPYYAAKIVEYRSSLGGYSYKEQLMDIWKFDEAKYEGLQDLIEVGPSKPYPLWRLPEDSLKLHPYIGKYAAHGIIVYRENTPSGQWSVADLKKAGVLTTENADKLQKCRIE